MFILMCIDQMEKDDLSDSGLIDNNDGISDVTLSIANSRQSKILGVGLGYISFLGYIGSDLIIA